MSCPGWNWTFGLIKLGSQSKSEVVDEKASQALFHIKKVSMLHSPTLPCGTGKTGGTGIDWNIRMPSIALD